MSDLILEIQGEELTFDLNLGGGYGIVKGLWFNTVADLIAYSSYHAGFFAGVYNTIDLYQFAENSTATHNGTSVVKPSAISANSPGRWVRCNELIDASTLAGVLSSYVTSQDLSNALASKADKDFMDQTEAEEVATETEVTDLTDGPIVSKKGLWYWWEKIKTITNFGHVIKNIYTSLTSRLYLNFNSDLFTVTDNSNANSTEIGLKTNQANGLVVTDNNNKISATQMPDLAITKPFTVTEQTLADFAANSANYPFETGDVAVITDTNGTVLCYMYNGGTKTNVASYILIDATKVAFSNILSVPYEDQSGAESIATETDVSNLTNGNVLSKKGLWYWWAKVKTLTTFGHVIKNISSTLTARLNLNFNSSLFTVSDNLEGNSTEISLKTNQAKGLIVSDINNKLGTSLYDFALQADVELSVTEATISNINNTKPVTARGLRYFIDKLKAVTNTFAEIITFTKSIVLSSVTANKWIMVDSGRKIVDAVLTQNKVLVGGASNIPEEWETTELDMPSEAITTLDASSSWTNDLYIGTTIIGLVNGMQGIGTTWGYKVVGGNVYRVNRDVIQVITQVIKALKDGTTAILFKDAAGNTIGTIDTVNKSLNFNDLILGRKSTVAALNSREIYHTSAFNREGIYIRATSNDLLKTSYIFIGVDDGATAYSDIYFTMNNITPFMLNGTGNANNPVVAFLRDIELTLGKYFYKPASRITDTLGDWRDIETTTSFSKEICTLANATKGSGTWKKVKVEIVQSLANNATLDLTASQSGYAECQLGDDLAYARFTFSSAGVVTLKDFTPNVIDSNTDTYLCIFDNGSNVRISNRLGSTQSLRITVNYNV